MEKIKNAISAAYQWLNKEGGMLHILACYAIMLTSAPLGYWWATAITWAVAIGKEAADLIRKTNNLQQVFNDLLRDAIGWAAASLVLLLQLLF